MIRGMPGLPLSSVRRYTLFYSGPNAEHQGTKTNVQSLTASVQRQVADSVILYPFLLFCARFAYPGGHALSPSYLVTNATFGSGEALGRTLS
jgi:hypothetical protein